MKPANSWHIWSSPPLTRRPQRESEGSSNRGAFTLVELLVIIGTVAVLAIAAAPALARAKDKSKRVQCLCNVNQFGMAIQLYATDYQAKLPSMGSGMWAWDLPWNVADELTSRGAQRHVMYDPAVPEQDNDALWNWYPGSFRVVGYALTFPGTATVAVTNQNASIIPKPITSGSITYPPPVPSARALLACATISNQNDVNNRDSNNYTLIYGGWGTHHSAHLNGIIPSGGNVGMLDGSVRWVKFASMIPRTASSSPYFWW